TATHGTTGRAGRWLLPARGWFGAPGSTCSGCSAQGQPSGGSGGSEPSLVVAVDLRQLVRGRRPLRLVGEARAAGERGEDGGGQGAHRDDRHQFSGLHRCSLRTGTLVVRAGVSRSR